MVGILGSFFLQESVKHITWVAGSVKSDEHPAWERLSPQHGSWVHFRGQLWASGLCCGRAVPALALSASAQPGEDSAPLRLASVSLLSDTSQRAIAFCRGYSRLVPPVWGRACAAWCLPREGMSAPCVLGTPTLGLSACGPRGLLLVCGSQPWLSGAFEKQREAAARPVRPSRCPCCRRSHAFCAWPPRVQSVRGRTACSVVGGVRAPDGPWVPVLCSQQTQTQRRPLGKGTRFRVLVARGGLR